MKRLKESSGRQDPEYSRRNPSTYRPWKVENLIADLLNVPSTYLNLRIVLRCCKRRSEARLKFEDLRFEPGLAKGSSQRQCDD